MSNIEYPYIGRIYRATEQIGEESPLEQTDTAPTLVAEFPCDVQRDGSGYKSDGGTLIFLYNIYFEPLAIEVKANDMFECDIFSNGKIVSFWAHDLGWELKVKDDTVL